MKSYPTIILLRHGQTEWNLESRYQGQLDSPLTLKGIVQVKVNANKLVKIINSFDNVKIFSSPLGRAHSSAFIICDELSISRDKIILEARIQEYDYGIFEGKTKEECQRLYPEEYAARETDKWFHRIQNGESYEIVTQRLRGWLEEIAQEELVVMVAHEMVNRALRGLYYGLDKEEILHLRQPNDVVLMLQNDREYIL